MASQATNGLATGFHELEAYRYPGSWNHHHGELTPRGFNLVIEVDMPVTAAPAYPGQGSNTIVIATTVEYVKRPSTRKEKRVHFAPLIQCDDSSVGLLRDELGSVDEMGATRWHFPSRTSRHWRLAGNMQRLFAKRLFASIAHKRESRRLFLASQIHCEDCSG
jgi:hypothetical protein